MLMIPLPTIATLARSLLTSWNRPPLPLLQYSSRQIILAEMSPSRSLPLMPHPSLNLQNLHEQSVADLLRLRPRRHNPKPLAK